MLISYSYLKEAYIHFTFSSHSAQAKTIHFYKHLTSMDSFYFQVCPVRIEIHSDEVSSPGQIFIKGYLFKR